MSRFCPASGKSAPGRYDERVETILPPFDPRAVMAFCRPRGFMAQQLGDFLQWDSGLEPFHCRSVSELMRVTIGETCRPKQRAEVVLPVRHGRLFFAVSSRPKEIIRVSVDDSQQLPCNFGRDRHTHVRARFLPRSCDT